MRVPSSVATAELVVKRSRFLSSAHHFDDPALIKGTVCKIRTDHPGCNHVVYAFVTGTGGSLLGMSDDGEPKGTAGRPVLEVLKGSGITNVIVTVVRYFGGTKLGTGGLVRAYSESARAVLAKLDTEELEEKLRFSAAMPYPFYEACRRLVESLAGSIVTEEFGTTISIVGELPAFRREELEVGFADLSGGGVVPVFRDQA